MTDTVVVDSNGDFEITATSYEEEGGYSDHTVYISYAEMFNYMHAARNLRLGLGTEDVRTNLSTIRQH